VANYRDEYLRVLVTREGFMGEKPCCPCGQPGIYRCCECSGAQIFCRECMVEQYCLRPLCRIEVLFHYLIFPLAAHFSLASLLIGVEWEFF
jgi:hypothetical protein